MLGSNMATQAETQVAIRQNNEYLRRRVAIPFLQDSQNRKRRNLSKAETRVSLSGPSVRKRRKGVAKTRTGCQTCKIQHTKCDETKPFCMNCTSTGRKCDFTKSSPKQRSRTNSLPSPKLPLLPFRLAPQDSPYYSYLVDACTRGLEGSFEKPLWSLVLQVSHTEPCIRYAALGALIMHRVCPFILANPNDPDYFPAYHSAFQHYTNAVRCLKDRIDSVKGEADNETWEISLLSSFLFASFEVLVGNDEGAYGQMMSGVSLMRNALKRRANQKSVLQGNMGELVRTYNRRDIQSSCFSNGYETQALLPPSDLPIFTSGVQAKNALDAIVPNILLIVRSRKPKCDLELKLSELRVILQKWLKTFEKYLGQRTSAKWGEPGGNCPRRDAVIHQILMIQYWTAFIRLRTPLPSPQTIHDSYLPQFTIITNLAEGILTRRQEPDSQFDSDVEIVYPLFYVAQKFRDGKLRRRAQRLLEVSGRGGFLDGMCTMYGECTAAAAAWCIEREEEGLKKGLMGSLVEGAAEFVEEKHRLRGATITYDQRRRTFAISCCRQREDGTEEVLKGSGNWGKAGANSPITRIRGVLWLNGKISREDEEEPIEAISRRL